ncbi:MAG: hypothetical protein MJZ31_06850 [Bacteroidales bacterium]|nr:hypothetical protein [Bacteroidales bacterium]
MRYDSARGSQEGQSGQAYWAERVYKALSQWVFHYWGLCDEETEKL